MNSQNIKTIDLNKHKDNIKYSWIKSQEGQIQSILVREFYHNKEYDINAVPRINIKELSILGYKNPQKAIRALIDRGVIKQSGDIIELITDYVYCNSCRDREVFIWEKLEHLKTFHHWHETTFKHNVPELMYSKKPLPEEIDHDYQQIGELKDNQFEVKCKNCGDKRTIYIDHVNKQCDPYYRNIFIENPDDDKDIKIRVGSNDDIIVLKNQEELKQFIQSKVNGA